MTYAPKESDFDWTGADDKTRRFAYTDQYNDWVPGFSMGEHDDWFVQSGLDEWRWHSSNASAWVSLRKRLTIVRFYDDALTTPDAVNPNHYKFPGGVEAIDLAKHQSYCVGNITKYAARLGRKAGADAVEDLRKIIRYAEFEIERLEQNSDR